MKTTVLARVMRKYSILELWTMSGTFSWVESILIGTFFVGLSSVLCAVNWYVQQEAILEYGYPKKKPKTMKKRMKQFTFWERITLTRLCAESSRKGFMLWLCWLLNLFNVLAAVACLVGYFGTIFTHGAGWALFLLVFVPLGTLCISVALRFIPDLLFLPSERRRYSRKK